MAEQNETPEAVPPTLSTGGKEHEPSGIAGVRNLIKPLYSKDHRVSITASCISRALARDSKDESRQKGKSKDPEEWDWLTPLRTQLRWTKLPLVYEVHLERVAPHAFATMREQHFSISPSTYAQTVSLPLEPLSNLGLSGSAFFHTSKSNASHNAGLFIKSINRAFEFEFMHETLLPAYISFMEEHPGADSILTRITDVIWSADASVGTLLNVSPRHYMVMVDILGDIKAIDGAQKWDLKPSGFFEPTRDLVPDAIKSEATKSGLADTLDADVRIKLSKSQYDSLLRVIERDTSFLEGLEIVDYSLLLGRFPASASPQVPLGFEHTTVLAKPVSRIVNAVQKMHSLSSSKEHQHPLTGDDFIKGVLSADREWVYRMTIVDFMWNVKKLVPTVMRTAGKVLPDQTITTEPARYKTEFLKMIEEYVDVVS